MNWVDDLYIQIDITIWNIGIKNGWWYCGWINQIGKGFLRKDQVPQSTKQRQSNHHSLQLSSQLESSFQTSTKNDWALGPSRILLSKARTKNGHPGNFLPTTAARIKKLPMEKEAASKLSSNIYILFAEQASWNFEEFWKCYQKRVGKGWCFC